MHLPYDLAIPLLDKYPGEMSAYVHRKTCTQMFMAFFMITKKGKKPKCPSTSKGYVVCDSQDGLLYSPEKYQMTDVCSNMDEPHRYSVE